MAGHSKWTQIKRKKAATDERRGRLFSKLLRAIEVAARDGGPNPEANPTLASAVEKARDYSVPWDNIERAIRRGVGATGGGGYEEVVYEGYGPGGVAILVQAMTDNRNRTAQEVKHTFSKLGGSLGDPGSVAWMFDRKGFIVVEKSAAPDEDRLLELILEAGAEDLRDSGEQWEVVTPPEALRAVRGALEAAGVPFVSAEVTMLPQTAVPVPPDKVEAVLRLVEALEDLDDVQAVWSNFDIPDEVLARAG
jgi:YebC/PmpR family DNA-binding regulatory protein